ncbi:MAG: hypothetical protein J0M15_14995 [Deltaproteobacteria bacterium]|nr:hypothetical protein [Deltaproteobacteria bacterium]
MNHIDIAFFDLLLVLSLALGVPAFAAPECLTFYSGKPGTRVISILPASSKLSVNPVTTKLKGQIVIRRQFAGVLSIPESVEIAQIVIKSLPENTVSDNTLTVINLFDSQTSKIANNVIINDGENRTVIISINIPIVGNAIKFPKILTIANTPNPNLKFKVSKKVDDSIYVSGLISISAEPPEAFFASSTRTEMKEFGFKNTHSNLASTWVVRAPDSRSETVFKYSFAAEGREFDLAYNDKFLVVAGIGPESAPTSSGFRESDMMISGDEQKGVLAKALQILKTDKLDLKALNDLKGIALRPNANDVILNGLNYTWSLTKSGFSDLVTNPVDYRKIISTEYDQFLSTLFEDGKVKRNKISYLLATSRGCTQGCAICCSGGLSPFQFFTGDRVLQDLKKIADLHRDQRQIDIFFVDSNFNNNPNRIIEIANLLENGELRGRFRFFVRHNTLNGFLSGQVEGHKKVNIELIDAYRKLGITEVMMGIDTYDNNSSVTLKSNRKVLAKKGINLRPIYSYQEIFNAVHEMNTRNMKTRGFLLTNNPFVSDLDRLDSYYNLTLLWASNPLFSVDARERNIIQLKPFEGSPVGDAAKSNPELVKDGRFRTKGLYGELDESMDFMVFNSRAEVIGIKMGLKALFDQRQKIIERSLQVIETPGYDSKQKMNAHAMLTKISQRDIEIYAFIDRSQNKDSQVLEMMASMKRDLSRFPKSSINLFEYQNLLFSESIEPLQRSLSGASGD